MFYSTKDMDHEEYVQKVIIKNLTNFDLGAHGSCQHIPHLLMLSHKCQFSAKFLTHQNFLILQNFILCRSGTVKLLISSQIFNATENFWILPNFILRRSRVVNLIFESNLQHRSKFFWILLNFILSWFGVVKTLFFEPNFQRDRKFLDFATFHHPHVLSGQISQMLRQIFNATKNFWILPTFIIRMFWVVKDLSLPRSLVVKSVNLESNFQRDWKFWICQISSTGPEWSKIWFLS